ncbi:MAG: hypothetical protein BAJALOKI1v1_460015 [Promethearchaeota archaeon]|nr:MAG: hypothetical protein BAJALOKI1v1_460015 [Candidatus Lokiarchaeota archaeon]
MVRLAERFSQIINIGDCESLEAGSIPAPGPPLFYVTPYKQ